MAKTKLDKGAVLFFEGCRYEVTGFNERGHFESAGRRGDKRPTMSSHPRHAVWLEPEDVQAELDAELAEWVGVNKAEKDPALRKALQSMTVANAREAQLAIGKTKGGFWYLPGRLIQPPVARPGIPVLPEL